MVDKVRAHMAALSEEGSKANKDKTRPMQMIMPIDVFEKVLEFLLIKSGKSRAQIQAMTGIEIVRTLGALEADTVAMWPRPLEISLPVGLKAVEAAVALGDWFTRGYDLTTNARKVVHDFRAKRISMATLPEPNVEAAAGCLNPRVVPLVDPFATLHQLCGGQSLKVIAQMPQLSEDAVAAKKFDCLLLALMGFTVVAEGRVAPAAYPDGCLDFISASNRLIEWDDTLNLAALRNMIPKHGHKASIDQNAASAACKALKSLCQGGDAGLEDLDAVFRDRGELLVLASQDLAGGSLPPRDQSSSHLDSAALTQVQPSQIASEHADPTRKRVKVRQEPELQLSRECVQENEQILVKSILTACSYASQPVKLSKVQYALKNMGSDATVAAEMDKTARLLVSMGLATQEGRSLNMMQPPRVHRSVAMDRFKTTLSCDRQRATSIETAWDALPINDAFSLPAFHEATAFFEKEEARQLPASSGQPAGAS